MLSNLVISEIIQVKVENEKLFMNDFVGEQWKCNSMGVLVPLIFVCVIFAKCYVISQNVQLFCKKFELLHKTLLYCRNL